MKLMPLSGGIAEKNLLKASSPPAEAPMPTTAPRSPFKRRVASFEARCRPFLFFPNRVNLTPSTLGIMQWPPNGDQRASGLSVSAGKHRRSCLRVEETLAIECNGCRVMSRSTEPVMNRPRVLLADDHTLVAQGIQKLLEPRFELVGTSADGRSLLEDAARLKPDVILLDISMPLLNGIDAARKLRKVAPDAKLLFLTMHADPTYVTEAFRAGGLGYLLKRSAASELVFAIEEVLKGRYYVTPAVAKDVMRPVFDEDAPSRREPPESAPRLTTRQREVLQLVAEGKSIKEIASILDISVKTVEFHKSRIMEELDLHTTADLTKYAVSHGIASLDPL